MIKRLLKTANALSKIKAFVSGIFSVERIKQGDLEKT